MAATQMKFISLKNILVLLGFGVLTLTGCKSTAGLKKGTAPQRTKEEVMQALMKHNIDFTWFTAKADAHFESTALSGSGALQLRIRKDSLVWMTGKKFSIEGFRSIINKDSFYLVNRIEKYYHAEANRSLIRTFGIDLNFEDVQHLLAGNMFLPQKTDSTYFVQSGDKCLLSSQMAELSILYGFDAWTMELNTVDITDPKGRKIEVVLGNYKKTKNLPSLPYNRKYTFHESAHEVSVLDIKIEEIEINVPKTVNFSIPSHYDRLRI